MKAIQKLWFVKLHNLRNDDFYQHRHQYLRNIITKTLPYKQFFKLNRKTLAKKIQRY